MARKGRKSLWGRGKEGSPCGARKGRKSLWGVERKEVPVGQGKEGSPCEARKGKKSLWGEERKEVPVGRGKEEERMSWLHSLLEEENINSVEVPATRPEYLTVSPPPSPPALTFTNNTLHFRSYFVLYCRLLEYFHLSFALS